MKVLRREWTWYLFILVPIAGTVMFNFYPLVRTLLMSFQNNSGKMIGSVNYNIMLKDDLFRAGFTNTIYMGILTLLTNLPLAFLLAVMINGVRWWKSVFKVVYLLPMIMSMVSTVMIFKFIFNPEPAGVLNYFLGMLGIKPQLWLASTRMSRESVVIMSLWKSLGYNVILFFAGLQSVPSELYEAATIDGANEGQRVWYITLPCIRNTLIFVYVTTCINVLKRFSDVFALSREYGLPGTSLMTIMLYIYRYSFATMFAQNYGIASAASMTLFALIMAITALNLFTTERNDTRLKVRRIGRIGRKGR